MTTHLPLDDRIVPVETAGGDVHVSTATVGSERKHHVVVVSDGDVVLTAEQAVTLAWELIDQSGLAGRIDFPPEVLGLRYSRMLEQHRAGRAS